jgi:hypothetical protein
MAEDFGAYVVVPPGALSPDDAAEVCARLTLAFIKGAAENGVDLSHARIAPWHVEPEFGTGMVAIGIHVV